MWPGAVKVSDQGAVQGCGERGEGCHCGNEYGVRPREGLEDVMRAALAKRMC